MAFGSIPALGRGSTQSPTPCAGAPTPQPCTERPLPCRPHGHAIVKAGLCDAHVHCTAASADLAALRSLPESYVTARAAHTLGGMLARGFTTVRVRASSLARCLIRPLLMHLSMPD